MNELCHLWRSERYEACGDDGRKGPFRAKRPRFPLVPPYGAPTRTQRSGFGGERTSSGVNEACRLRRAEGYAACEDEVRRRWCPSSRRT